MARPEGRNLPSSDRQRSVPRLPALTADGASSSGFPGAEGRKPPIAQKANTAVRWTRKPVLFCIFCNIFSTRNIRITSTTITTNHHALSAQVDSTKEVADHQVCKSTRFDSVFRQNRLTPRFCYTRPLLLLPFMICNEAGLFDITLGNCWFLCYNKVIVLTNPGV
jgi:hypothetical protein